MATFYHAIGKYIIFILGDNLFAYSHPFVGDISQGHDAFIASLQTWYNSLPAGIIITRFAFPGTGVCIGEKSNDRYGNFLILCDGVTTHKYVDVSGGTITTNFSEP